MGSNICPVTGHPCNKPTAFVINEQLGDKSQSTTCCRDCAAGFVQARNNFHYQKQIEASGIPVYTADQFVNKILNLAEKPVPLGIKPTPNACPGCGWTFAHIRAKGRVGCATCYDTFWEELKTTLETKQHGMVHTGKVPLSAKLAGLPPEDQIKVLERSLNKAIDKEDYEQAARYRDMIKKIRGIAPPDVTQSGP